MLRDTKLIRDVGIRSTETFESLASNPERMALISSRAEPGSVWEADGIDWPITTTAFGNAFIEACTTRSEQSQAGV
jgi:hypothetical protein